MAHYWSIILCNGSYKIIFKVLVNRTREVLSDCIGECNSAFVKGRSISDNIMVAYEVLQALKAKMRGNTSMMAVKLDMSKGV